MRLSKEMIEVIQSMVGIMTDPNTDDDEYAAALATLKEALD